MNHLAYKLIVVYLGNLGIDSNKLHYLEYSAPSDFCRLLREFTLRPQMYLRLQDRHRLCPPDLTLTTSFMPAAVLYRRTPGLSIWRFDSRRSLQTPGINIDLSSSQQHHKTTGLPSSSSLHCAALVRWRILAVAANVRRR